MALFSRFLTDDTGATAIEYGLIAGLLSVAIVSGLQAYGAGLLDMYYTIAGSFPDY